MSMLGSSFYFITKTTSSGPTWLGFVTPILALAVSVVAILLSYRAFRNVSWSQQALNVQNSLINEYLDRKLGRIVNVEKKTFRVEDAVWEDMRRFGKASGDSTSLELETLKQARQLAEHVLKDKLVEEATFMEHAATPGGAGRIGLHTRSDLG